jgi:hypothetical protein
VKSRKLLKEFATGTKDKLLPDKISGSHGGVYDDGCLTGGSAVWSGGSLPTYQRCLQPQKSGRCISRAREIPALNSLSS